jgi:hypothetical protein
MYMKHGKGIANRLHHITCGIYLMRISLCTVLLSSKVFAPTTDRRLRNGDGHQMLSSTLCHER